MVEEIRGGAFEGEPLPLVKIMLGTGPGVQHSSQRAVQCCLRLLLDGTEVSYMYICSTRTLIKMKALKCKPSAHVRRIHVRMYVTIVLLASDTVGHLHTRAWCTCV